MSKQPLVKTTRRACRLQRRLQRRSRGRDTIFLLPLSTETSDMVPDAPGIWLFHCHLDDHMEAGMMGRYEVLPAPAGAAETTPRPR